MINKENLIITLLTLLVLFFAPAIFAKSNINTKDDINAGKTKALTCVACHGPDGNSLIMNYPKIAGQNQRYFIEQMLDFKQGIASGRVNPIMSSIVFNLSPTDIADLAAYFNTQTMSIDGAQAQYIMLGQLIYRGGLIDKGIPACAACHGPQGEGNAEAGFPHLGGQHRDYLIAQLQAYRNGQRRNDINHIMGTIAGKMSDAEITAVSSYIAGLY